MEKTRLYLDQFAISCMADVNSQWSKVKDTLLRLKEKEKIECVTSIESVFETTQRHQQGAIENYTAIASITDNVYLKNLLDIICMQIDMQVRGAKYNRSDYIATVYHDFSRTEIIENDKDIIKEFKESGNCANGELLDMVSSILDIIRKSESLAVEYMNNDIEKFKSTLSVNSIPTQPQYDILKHLATVMNFSNADFQELYLELQNNGYRNIPSLYIQTLLDGHLLKLAKKDFFNNIIDIRRLAVSIPTCDVITCDSAWKNVLISLGLDKTYNCKFFSAKDFDSLECYLNEL